MCIMYKHHLLARVANIELYNLRHICPFLYKKQNVFVEIKNVFTIDTKNIAQINNDKIPLSNVYFKKYKKSISNNSIEDKCDFYEWLDTNTDYISNISELYNCLSLFNLSNMPEYKEFEKFKIINSSIDKSILIPLMETENFIFID